MYPKISKLTNVERQSKVKLITKGLYVSMLYVSTVYLYVSTDISVRLKTWDCFVTNALSSACAQPVFKLILTDFFVLY